MLGRKKPQKSKVVIIQVNIDDVSKALKSIYEKYDKPSISVIQQSAYWYQIVVVFNE